MLLLPMILAATAGPVPGRAEPVLRASDVVFMYQAKRETYEAYGATVLAWGGTPTPETLAEARDVRWFGSVGMVTEFAAYHDRFPDTWREGLCKDINGQPFRVPWLTDHQHKGEPYWWCCTRQPLPRTFFRERVVQTIRAGAQGLHVDDHLGTAGALWLGACFCDRCVEGFREHLRKLPARRLATLGIRDPATFDFRQEARAWLASNPGKSVTAHPLWEEWSAYQYHGALELMMELRELAARTAGKPVPVGANAGLLWPGHLADYEALDLFTAETDHHASERRMPDEPLLAYRLAEALGRPYAATASGWDWAYVKEHNLHGLVRGWIALSYAAGQRLMAPHYQWCYTTEKGTHWYHGPTEQFAPLYRFVRKNAALFDGCTTHADLALVMPHRSFRRNTARWLALCSDLAARQIGFRIILAGDEIVRKPLSRDELRPYRTVLAPDRDALDEEDARLLQAAVRGSSLCTTLEEALARIRPALRVQSPGPVRAFARTAKGRVAVHLVNFDYDRSRDAFRPQENIRVALDLAALGVPRARSCRIVSPDGPEVTVPIENGVCAVPRLTLWAIMDIR